MNNYEIEMMRYYIRNYSGVAANKELAPMNVILQYWEHNKGNYLRKMFGEELILSKEITYTKPSEEIYDDMACLKENNEFYKNYMDFANTFWFENRDLYWHIVELMNTTALVNNNYRWENFTIGKTDVRTGCKIIRVLGKIAKEFNLEGFEEFRLEHSRILNEKLFKGELCLSIHPMDYMTMSDNDCDWTSCMSWIEKGCYRSGSVEMMNSPCVVVGYLKSKHPFNISDEYVWNNKKWRSLFIVNKDFISNVKGYPYQNEVLSNICINWLADIASKKLGWNYNDKIYSAYDEEIFYDMKDRSWCINFTTNKMYNDLCGSQFNCRISPDTINTTITFNYSGESSCVCTGEILDNCYDTEDLVSYESRGMVHCDGCGSWYFPYEGDIINNKHYCRYCCRYRLTTCPITNETYPKNEMYRFDTYHSTFYISKNVDLSKYFNDTTDNKNFRYIGNNRYYVNSNNLTEEGKKLLRQFF